MASILKVDTITGVATAGSIAITGEGNSTTTNLQQGLAKQWVNYKSAATFETRDSFNMSSLTDNGAGNAKPVFTSAMNNTDYSYTATNNLGMAVGNRDERTTSTYKIVSQNSNGTNADTSDNSVAVHGDLA